MNSSHILLFGQLMSETELVTALKAAWVLDPLIIQDCYNVAVNVQTGGGYQKSWPRCNPVPLYCKELRFEILE